MANSNLQLQQELSNLHKAGVVLPRSPMRAVESARQMKAMVQDPGALAKDISSAVQAMNNYYSGGNNVSPEVAHLQQNNKALMSAMGTQRRISSMRKTGGTDAAIAIPRFYDPLEYWDLSGLPWNMADEGHRHKLHKWLRLYYATHRLIPTLIDIFTRFPLIGLEFHCPDKKITEFYEDLFLDQLDYSDFLVSLGREYWTVGEAFPLGSFNEALGVWEREELLNPEDIVIENFPLLGTRQIKVVPPEYLKRLASTKSPPDQYKQLEQNFPDLLPYLRRGEPFPVSEVLLKQVAFKITDWDDHGTPLMLRGLRTLLHEEKLLASQDAIAERLYSPLILAKLGIQNMGDQEGPWIPSGDQLESFRDDMDLALSSDFRMMVYHYGLDIENVFGREQVPDLWNDFDRITTWLLQIFGLQGILGTGTDAQPYATSALNAEFMNQMLGTYQHFLKKHTQSRMEVVAEAQGHYAYEKRGQTRVPIMEEVVEWDENGDPHIVERHKLLVPDVKMQTLDLRDEATERQFRQSLRSMGVPVSDQNLMVGIDFDFKDSLDEMYEETIQKTVTQQMAKLQTYKILKAQGLSIPPELQAELEGGQPGAPGAGGMPGGGMPGGAPPMGGGGLMGGGAGGPGIGGPIPGGGESLVMPPAPPGIGGGGPQPFTPGGPGGGPGGAPDISHERPPIHGNTTANSWAKTAKFSVEEIAELDSLTEAEIDERIASSKKALVDIEFMKRLRTSNFDRTGRSRHFDTEDMTMIKIAADQKIVIDKVPPKLRRDLLN